MAKPKSIAILLPSYHPIGVVRAMFRLSTGLMTEGIEVTLVLLFGDDRAPYPVPNGLRVETLSTPSASNSDSLVASYLSRALPDAVLAASNPCALAAVRGRELSGIRCRVVITLRTELSKLWEEERRSLSAEAVRRISRSYARADAVLAVSGGVADDLAGLTDLPRDSMRVIYNGIDRAEAQRRAAQTVEHPWLNRHLDDAPIVLGVGRLSPQKDFPTLLQAVAILRNRRPVRLLILGEGPQRRELLSQATALGFTPGKDFSLPGFHENPLPFMRRADVFALSSTYEGLPNVVLEALAVGTPVVSTDCPSGPHELLDGGTFGPLVPVGDADALAEAIDRTLANPLPSERLQERAGVFSVQRMVSDYLDVLLG